MYVWRLGWQPPGALCFVALLWIDTGSHRPAREAVVPSRPEVPTWWACVGIGRGCEGALGRVGQGTIESKKVKSTRQHE
jgi:hypothetical protein